MHQIIDWLLKNFVRFVSSESRNTRNMSETRKNRICHTTLGFRALWRLGHTDEWRVTLFPSRKAEFQIQTTILFLLHAAVQKAAGPLYFADATDKQSVRVVNASAKKQSSVVWAKVFFGGRRGWDSSGFVCCRVESVGKQHSFIAKSYVSDVWRLRIACGICPCKNDPTFKNMLTQDEIWRQIGAIFTLERCVQISECLHLGGALCKSERAAIVFYIWAALHQPVHHGLKSPQVYFNIMEQQQSLLQANTRK